MVWKDKNQDLRESLAYLPDKPGVYIMKNGSGDIIYVGKAKSLKKRVGSYFLKNIDRKTEFLIRKTETIEPFITSNEYEALLLENTLIKKHQPHYNINLKDGKTYPVIRITNEQFPRVFRTRRFVQDGSHYFGPYPNVKSIDVYLELIDKLFPLRKCKGRLKKRKHPCLFYHIHRCAAPCAGRITEEEYKERVEQVIRFLSGDTSEIIDNLHQNMKTAAEQMDYEKAAEYRDLIQAVHTATAEQMVVDFDPEIRDYISFIIEEQMCTFSVFKMRGGTLIGRDVFQTSVYGLKEEALHQFLLQYYSQVHHPPSKVYVDIPIDIEPLKTYFLEKMGREVDIIIPEDGANRSVLQLAKENSRQDMDRRVHQQRVMETLQEVQKALALPAIPRRIEGFDISQLSGKYPVASMVSFFNGRPEKKNYRHYHMKSLQGKIDDYEAIREVVARRYTRVVNEQVLQPDLILIDGGKGQVHAAYGILRSLGLEHIPVFGLAKQQEEVVPIEGESIMLEDGSPALRLLQFVRDESHRFATTFNKKLRSKDIAFSRLEKIPGIGPKRSKKLLETFGSIATIVNASPEYIVEQCGLSRELAERIISTLKGEEA